MNDSVMWLWAAARVRALLARCAADPGTPTPPGLTVDAPQARPVLRLPASHKECRCQEGGGQGGDGRGKT
ncbi:MAG: hypothetical protein ACRCV9_00615 [Burkholderiaceae bacterium]